MKKLFLFAAMLIASALGSDLFAQLDATKTYTIANNNDATKFMQDNGTGVVAIGSKNDYSYWKFVPTANADCYYIQNAKTGKYIQGYTASEQEVATGDAGVEYYVKADADGSLSGKYRMSCTANSPHDFSDGSGTLGLNWKNNNTVQSFASIVGGNPRSAWIVTEEAMPQPITGLSSLYAGVEPAVGTEYYLYNLKTGKWLGDNHVNTDGSWTSHGELGPRGRDIELKAGNADGRFQLNPKLGHNYSINGSNLYMDTGDGVTNWIFTPVDVDGVTNCYKLTTPGGKAMGANSDGWATSDPAAIAENGNVWQLVSREQRLAAMQVGDDCSWLVLGGTFPVDDSHKGEEAYRVWQGSYGDNAIGGDGHYHCNRVWELWGISSRDVYQDIIVPNGKYKFKAQAIYVSTGGGDMNADRYNEYLADPTGNTKGVVYANNATTPMINVYSLVTNEKVNDKNTKEITSGVWAYNGTNEFSTNIFEGKGWTDEVEVEVKDGKLRVGAKVEGATSAWMLLDNFTLTYSGEVVIEDLTPYIQALEQAIAAAESFDSSKTTEALATALATALANAQSVSRTDANAMTTVTNALEEALQLAQTVDVTVLRATIEKAQADGISVPTSVTDFLVNGTVNEVETHLRLVRNLRKLNAIEKVDITRIECSEPANEEADYYLYNVGAGIFFSTTADWGTHIAIDNPGMLIHFRPDGEWSGAAGRPVFHLSGNGWNGMNWQEEYWDKNGENKLAFVPVEGKDKVYNMCEWDNYNWHFVYDPADDVCDGNTHYWNAVQKRDWNRNDYKDNPYAQWMLVSPEAYKAAMYKATETNPLDVTFLIENPNFTKAKVDGADNWDRGWTGVGTMTGRGRDPWCAIEWYEANANMSQTISGLTPGKYQVSCYGFYRDGSCANEAEKTNNGEALIQNAFLYANDKEVALPNVSSETGNMPGIGEKDEVKYEFACWPWEANEYFQTGLYKATTPVVEVGEDGELTIGIKSTYNNVGESWVVVGNFRLTCLGVTEYVTIGDANYTTFVAPYNIASMPEGVEAYACQVNENSVHLEPVTAIPAGEAVVLKNAGTYTFRPATSTVELGADNDLLPSDGTVQGANIFALANKSEGVGFYRVSEEIAVPAGKGYLVIGDAGVKSFYGFDEDDATAIEMVNGQSSMVNGPIFNLAGQRMSKQQKGINIINGKKILK
jgi:hypothetical protein